MSAGTHGASDIFGLGSDWEPQTSNKNTANEHADATGANGDVVAETTYGENVTVSCPYIYVGAETTLTAALDAIDTAAGGHVGQQPGTYTITSIAVDLSPLGEGKRAVITFTGVDGFSADSEIYKPTITVTLTIGTIPDLLTNSDADSECTSATYTITAQYGTDADASGDILRGATYKGVETLALGYFGIPTLTTTGWQQTSATEDTSNSDFFRSSYAFMNGVDRE
jgi:hypothetical protein